MHIRHRWVTVAAKHMERIYESPVLRYTSPSPGEPITVVLQRCSIPGCDKQRTQDLDGHWTIEQLTKEV